MIEATRITWFIFSIWLSVVLAARRCEFDAEGQCSETESCNEATNTCQCLPGYERGNETHCVPFSPEVDSTPNYSSLVDNQGSGSIVAGILTPLCLIVMVMCGIYVTRRYHLIAWIRSKFNRRNENYDEFMIGQDLDDDDPPLH
nr:unnamed protein product [Callosobruchus chinensis]